MRSRTLEYAKLEKLNSKRFESLVRIGNMKHNSPYHIWNALFYGFKSYRNLRFQDKMEYIAEQRIKVAANISREEWNEYGNTSHIILREFRKLFVADDDSDFVPALSDTEKEIDTQALRQTRLCVDLFSQRVHVLDDVIANIQSYENVKESLIKELVKRYDQKLTEIEHDEQKEIQPAQRQKCIRIFSRYLSNTWDAAKDKAYRKLAKSLKDRTKHIDLQMLPLVLRALPFKVFFIDPVKDDIVCLDESYRENMQSTDTTENQIYVVLLMHREEQAFESLGIYSDADLDFDDELVKPGANAKPLKNIRISRLFTRDDEVIETCFQRLEAHEN